MYIEFELRAPIHTFIGSLHQRRGLLLERTLGEKQFGTKELVKLDVWLSNQLEERKS